MLYNPTDFRRETLPDTGPDPVLTDELFRYVLPFGVLPVALRHENFHFSSAKAALNHIQTENSVLQGKTSALTPDGGLINGVGALSQEKNLWIDSISRDFSFS